MPEDAVPGGVDAMNNTKWALIMSAFAFIPYLLVAWGYTRIADGSVRVFWIALGLLIGARFFFSVIETVGSILAWRLYGRRLAIDRNLAFLRTNNSYWRGTSLRMADLTPLKAAQRPLLADVRRPAPTHSGRSA